MTVRAVWSDFGGVLTPPIGRDLEDFCARTGIPAPAFRAAMAEVARPFGGDIMAPLDTPLLSEEEWAARVTAEIRGSTGIDVDLSDFGDRWFEGRQTNHDWRRFLQEVHDAGGFVGLLSNMPPAWDRQWRRMVEPDGLFDALVLSFQVGARKPERKIFDLAAEAACLPPEECVLVDDIEANCAGAEAAGWQAVHFTGAADAVARLRPLLTLPSPRAGAVPLPGV
ncbi:HAD family phosphatase [Streptomyces sp. NPDC048275]|uniref:HAD family hydrolase n=1 Tax=Streptomyces sp. NPDC048275 TaxID=3155629 RepID=UPI0033CCC461